MAAALGLVSWLGGCSGRTDLRVPEPDVGGPADAGPVIDAGPELVEVTDKVDLLLVVDNSKNLGAAQDLFANTLPYLLDRLARPACVNGLGNVVAETSTPEATCPVGERDFAPVTDFHVGVVSTSLGGHGADVCSPTSPSFDATMDDAGHLLARTATGGVVPTYEHQGFLAWDPGQDKQPPGEFDLPTVKIKLDEMLRGVGTRGCGFEAQLESIYRFLVDPNPYAEIIVSGDGAEPSGTDEVLLAQRADFLRPDSAVVIVLLTDENDCSTRDGGQYYLSNQGSHGDGSPFHLPRARAVCADDPGDACCASCGQQTPPGCSPSAQDPGCLAPPFTVAEDPINLRCFDQKRRFGVDFLYPVERYVAGLTERTVEDRDGNVVDNPLFAGLRSPSLVLMAGIVGVPWQDIATDPKVLSTGFLPATKVDWPLVVGDGYDPPADPLMLESIAPRTGENPRTGDELAPPSSTTALANPINGHERDITTLDDLQYACIYPLSTPRDCATAAECECLGDDVPTNPICQQQDGTYAPIQRFARALPSTRVLRVLRGLGDQAVVASVCAQNVDDFSAVNYGYKPAVDAVMRSLRLRLRQP